MVMSTPSINVKLEMLRQWVCRWKKTAVSVCLLLFIWLFGGAVVLPYALQYALEKIWASQIQRVVSVEDVRFNPLHGALTVSQLRIQEPDGAVLVGFESFFIDYDIMSIFRLEYGLDTVELYQPSVRLVADGSGGYTIQALAGASSSIDEPTTEETVKMPSVWLKKLEIHGASIDYMDEVNGKPFSKHVELVNLSLQDFHTQAVAHKNSLDLVLRDGKGATVEWTGKLNIDPMQIDGRIVVTDLDMTSLLDSLLPPQNFVLRKMQLDMDVPHIIQFDQADKPDIRVDGARVRLRDIQIAADINADAVIQLSDVEASEIAVDLTSQSVRVGQLMLNKGRVEVEREADGILSLQKLFSAPAKTPPAASVTAQTHTAVAETAPWSFQLQSVTVADYAVHVIDRVPSTPVEIHIAPVQFKASGIQYGSVEPVPLELSAGLPASGELVVQGQAVLSPLTFNGKMQLRQGALSLIQPYVAEQARIVLAQGLLDAAMTVDVSVEPEVAMVVSGAATVRDLDVREREQNRKLLSWHLLDVAGLAYTSADNRLQVDSVDVSKPYSRFIINKDGTTNIQALLVDKPVRAAAVEPAGTAPPLALLIKKVVVDDADLGFSDLTLNPDFRVTIEKLNGRIENISTDPDSRATVDLRGKVDHYAPAKIQGKCNVLGAKPVLDMGVSFSDIELTTFTPYSGTYAGFVIDKGQLSLDLNYSLENNRIKGKNHIVMKQLQLGKKVENKASTDLPIRLAIALLRDENGVIDLGFDVDGNVDDPSFSVGGLFFKVLGNVVKKAVTSPFNLLSGLLGDTPGEPDRVAFAFGDVTLDKMGQTKVDGVATMLKKRSLLQLSLRGRVAPKEDKLALQQQKLAARLADETGLTVDDFINPDKAVENGRARRLVGRLIHDARHDELKDIEARIREDRQAKQQSVEKQAIRVAAYQQAWLRLAGDVPVGDSDLRQLGLARASQVKNSLMEQHGISPDRVFVLDALVSSDIAPPAAEVQMGFQAK